MRDRAYTFESLPALTSKRLLYRALTEKDVPSYFALCKNESTMRAYGLLPHTSVEQTQNTVAVLQRWFEQGRALRWGIFSKEDPEQVLGDIGYWQFDLIRDRGELGVKLDPSKAGKGLGREAMQTIIQFGFESLDLKGVDANIAPGNTPSIGLAKRLGFTVVGIRPQLSYSLIEEEWSDMTFLTLNRRDWTLS